MFGPYYVCITWGCAQWRFWNTFASNTFLSCKRLHTNVSSDEGFEKRKTKPYSHVYCLKNSPQGWKNTHKKTFELL